MWYLIYDIEIVIENVIIEINKVTYICDNYVIVYNICLIYFIESNNYIVYQPKNIDCFN